MNIRTATKIDRDAIRQVCLEAFGEEERELVAGLAVELLEEDREPGNLNLLAEEEGRVIGQMALSPVRVERGGPGFILAPLAVTPGRQKHGVGSGLVREGLRRLKQQGIGWVLVYGDPNYYGRFGFRADLAAGFVPPFGLSYPHGWQALWLGEDEPGIRTGRIECVEALNKAELW